MYKNSDVHCIIGKYSTYIISNICRKPFLRKLLYYVALAGLLAHSTFDAFPY